MDDDLSAEKTRMLDTPDKISPDHSFHFSHVHKAVNKDSPFKRGLDLRVQIPNQMHLRKGAVVVSPHANIFMDEHPLSASSQKPDSELILHTCADIAMEYEDACHTPVGEGHESFPDPSEIAVKRQATKKRSNSLYSRKDYTPMLKRASSMLQYDNHYQCVELLGKGQFGEVWSARHYRTKEMFALKRSTRTFRGCKDRDTFIREISSMSSIKPHRNVIRCGDLDANRWAESLMLLVAVTSAHGKMVDIFTSLWSCVKVLFRPAAHACYLHWLINPGGNLAKVLESLDRPMPTKRIGDFGLCIREDEWEDQEGDRRYLAPEILNSQATCKSDVFSAGLIVFQLPLLFLYFTCICRSESQPKLLKNLNDLPGNGTGWHLLRENFSFSAADPEQEGLAQIVVEMMKKDPERRLSSYGELVLEEARNGGDVIMQMRWHVSEHGGKVDESSARLTLTTSPP
eukprot:760577-Hanusia_phi.AAC.1